MTSFINDQIEKGVTARVCSLRRAKYLNVEIDFQATAFRDILEQSHPALLQFDLIDKVLTHHTEF